MSYVHEHLRDQVTEDLGSRAGQYDVEAIVCDLQFHGTTDLSDLSQDAYGEVLSYHRNII